VAADIGTWHRVEERRDQVTLGVVDRPGAKPSPVPGWRVERVTMPALDVSSSDVRTRLAEGRSADFLVPAAAIRCIRRLNLYADSR
jgi:nicotinate-nucleotide adenylyltransferase